MADRMVETPEIMEEGWKKKKKKKLSKAEKASLKLLAALELKRTLMREQLLREIDLTNKSLKRGRPLWDDMCKSIKINELRKEIQDWGIKTEQLMDKKDTKIDVLMKGIEETEEIHERNYCNHLEKLTYLSECHQTLLDTTKAVYEAQVSDMIQDFMLEVNKSLDVLDYIKEDEEKCMHGYNVVAKMTLRKNYELYMTRKFDIVTAQIETRYQLRHVVVKRMRTLHSNLLIWIRELQGSLIDVRKTERFLYYMQRQRNYVTESDRLNDLERISRRTIKELQMDLLDIESDSNRKIYGFKLEQAYFLEVRSLIKNSIEKDKQVTHEKLKEEASESYRVINKLKEIVKNGELLLGLAMCCRKYKTEKEKVLACGNVDDAIFDNELMFKMQFDIMKHLDITEEELTSDICRMKNFWCVCSNVKFHNLLLMEELRKLIEENKNYKNIIRSMKKSDDVKYICESFSIKQV